MFRIFTIHSEKQTTDELISYLFFNQNKTIMRKFKLAVVALLVSLVTMTGVQAQSTFKKSDKIVEGMVSYSKSKGADAVYTVAPSFGYFVSDKSVVGVTAEFGTSANGDVTNFGVYGRNYFHTIGKNLLTYAQVNAASNTTKDPAGVKTSEFAAGFGLGANYFVSRNVAVSMHVASERTRPARLRMLR